MIKQTIFFSTPVMLSLKNAQMVISWKDNEDKITRPIEDIGCVILENQMISISMPLLNELVKNNVAVILCDNKQMPTAMLQPLESNSTQAEIMRIQLSATEPSKKQAWKQVVEAKIHNQMALLNKYCKGGDLLKPLAQSVKSGDTDNREGLAAKIYWNRLLGADFTRERHGSAPNNLLNYGYTILRAAVARALLGSGLMPNLGIFHKNRYNAFPLADDIMEPYRPFVDEIVYNLHIRGCKELDKHTKTELIKVLGCDVVMDKKLRPLQIALSSTTASLAKFLSGEIKKLVLPDFQ